MISCSSELTAGFLILTLLQVFSKRKVSLLWKGADGEDRSAGTREEFAAASEKKEAMLPQLGLLAGQSYTKPPCLSSCFMLLGKNNNYMKLKRCCLGRQEGTVSSNAA